MTSSLEATDRAAAAVATRPRVALADIEAKIAHRYDVNGADAAAMATAGGATEDIPPSLDVLSICLLVMINGFTVIGKSAPASPENFDPELGKAFAYQNAIRQLWPLEGYALRERLMQQHEQAAKLQD